MRRLLRGIVAAVSIERRRTASIVACAGGIVAGLSVSLRGPSSLSVPVELLVGGLLAVAALGELPSGLVDAAWRWRGEPFVWAGARAVFPLAGAAAGAMGSGRIGIAIVATASAQAVVQHAGCRGSEPATAALLLAVAAAGAAAAGLPLAWLTAAWAAAVWAVGRLARTVTGPDRTTCPRGRGRTVWLWPLPSQGRLRPAMTAMAMVAGLASMAAWLVPQPPRADHYAAIATALFVALAVPQMTLADGVVDRLGWAMVLRGAVPGRIVWPPSGRIAFAHATMFVWPLLVAGVLTVRLPGAALASASAAAGVLLVAALAAAIALPTQMLSRPISDGSAETAQAIILSFFAACCGWWGPRMLDFFRVFPGLSP